MAEITAEEEKELKEMIERHFQNYDLTENVEKWKKLKKERLEIYRDTLLKLKELNPSQKERMMGILDQTRKDREEREKQKKALKIVEIIKGDERFKDLRKILSEEKGINL